jgi:hypothetical protein
MKLPFADLLALAALGMATPPAGEPRKCGCGRVLWLKTGGVRLVCRRCGREIGPGRPAPTEAGAGARRRRQAARLAAKRLKKGAGNAPAG